MSLTPSAHRSYRNLDSRRRANRVRPPHCFRVPAAAISAARRSRSTQLGADQSRIARSPVGPLNRRGHNSGTPMWGIFRFVGRSVQRSLPTLSEAMGCAIGIPHRSPHRINHRDCHAVLLLNQVLIGQPLAGRTFDHTLQPIHRRIVDMVLRYRPKAKSKPAVQRKRRKTILEKKRAEQS